MSELLSCPMCSYVTAREEQLLRHVFQIHEHDPKFQVYCSACGRSFTKLESLRKHKYRSSGCSSQSGLRDCTLLPRLRTPDPDDEMPNNGLEGLDPVPQCPSTKWQAAAFILSIKEKHMLSQAAIDTVLSSTTSLVGTLLQGVLTGLRDLPEEVKTVLDEKMSEGAFEMQPFEGLGTAYLQKKYFRESFHLVVSLMKRAIVFNEHCLHVFWLL